MQNKISKAFALMRKQGVITRQSFLCCSSCAGAAMPALVAKQLAKGKAVSGAVFYHRQDAQRWLDGKPLFIRFGAVHIGSTVHGDTLAVGRAFARALNEVGIPFKWDGTEDACFELDSIAAGTVAS